MATTKQQPIGDNAVSLRKELAQEEKAIRKAQSMELLRSLSTKLTSVQKSKNDFVKKEETLESIREEIYTAFAANDSARLDDISSKLAGLGY